MRSLTRFLVMTLLLAGANALAAAPDKDLKLRVQGYVDTMLDGNKAAMLKVKDYYSTVYLAKSGKVEELSEEANGGYRAVISFQTTGRIQQNGEVKPHSSKRIQKEELIRQTVFFRIKKGMLHWAQPLDSPFVKSGHESRYLLVEPIKTEQ